MRKRDKPLNLFLLFLVLAMPLSFFPKSTRDVEDNILYAGTLTAPAKVLKIDLNNFQIVDTLKLEAEDGGIHAMDISDEYLYTGSLGKPARIIQIKLSDFTRVKKVTLPDEFSGAVVFKVIGDYLFDGTWAGQIVKLNAKTLELIDYAQSPEGGLILGICQVGDYLYVSSGSSEGLYPWVQKLRVSDLYEVAKIRTTLGGIRELIAVGNYLYVLSAGDPSGLTRIDLSTFTEVDYFRFSTPYGRADFLVKYGDYFYSNGDTSPYGRVYKVRISDFTWVGYINISEARACDIKLSEHYLYISTLVEPSKIIKVDLDTFQEVAKLNTGEGWIVKMAVTPKKEAPPPTEFTTVTGTVTDSNTLKAVSGAIVVIDGYSAVTNQNGGYIITNLPLGLYTVSVNAAGYETKNITLNASSSSRVYTVDFQIRKIPATSEDNLPPRITSVTITPSDPTPSDDVVIACKVADDESGVKEVNLLYQIKGDAHWNKIPMSYVEGWYKANIPRQKEGTIVQYYVEAFDNSLNIEKSSTSSYTVKAPKEMPRSLFPIAEVTVIAIVFAVIILLWLVLRRRKTLKNS